MSDEPEILDPEMTQDDEGYIANSDAGRMGKAVEYLVAAGCILTTRRSLSEVIADRFVWAALSLGVK